ncbi:MARVEL domain-containing protein 2b [Chanos chanos]|uniref:MARVEL domain-containing protein 2b n=1 Tax=Chanos chanos TaxID=29144 RepID=A0A6J2WTW6_CHACN|nr:MARVEL domain-containing protein 2 [Chanos chanos]
MSVGNGSASRFDRVREAPYYDEVPVGSLARDQGFPYPLVNYTDHELALSADPLPPPPLPENPPVGPEFYPSDTEEHNDDSMDIKPVHRFIPDSVKNFFRSSNRWSIPRSTTEKVNATTEGVPCSPPNSRPPSPNDGFGADYSSAKERDVMPLGAEALESVSGRSQQTRMTYSEKVEDYNQRYAYMKSWAGLLRILGCIELLLGAVVFACVCAYIHKDNEWFNMYGYSQAGTYGGGFGGGFGGGQAMYGTGSQYTGPRTPFVLVVAGLAWLVTVILVVLGMSMYYRTILLDSSWWPFTECALNLALGILYMAAGIVYVNDTKRGGLCNTPFFNSGPNSAFCRTEAGQTAAIVFLFLNMVLYLIGAGVCLKLWRHEAARMRREAWAFEMKTTGSSVPLHLVGPGSSVSAPTHNAPLMARPEDTDGRGPSPAPVTMMEPEILRGHIPAGHIPKPVVIADYVAKYPSIRTDEQRDQYKAVFNDQYEEYKELHAEVQALAKKFEEMDNLMMNLPSRPSSQMEEERINHIIQEYKRKKADPTFLEKKERCEYLKNKLSHIKSKIQDYDSSTNWDDYYY